MKSNRLSILFFITFCGAMDRPQDVGHDLLRQREHARYELLHIQENLSFEHKRVAAGMVVGGVIIVLADHVENIFPWFGVGLRCVGTAGMGYGVWRSMTIEEKSEQLGRELLLHS